MMYGVGANSSCGTKKEGKKQKLNLFRSLKESERIFLDKEIQVHNLFSKTLEGRCVSVFTSFQILER